MTDSERRVAERAVRRRRLFLVASLVSVVVALALAGYTIGCRIQDPSYPLRSRAALVILILLNARNSLRTYRFAGVIRALLPSGDRAVG